MSCRRLGFRSKREARKSVARTQSQIKGGVVMVVHRCPDATCRMWHTSPRPPAREVPPPADTGQPPARECGR